MQIKKLICQIIPVKHLLFYSVFLIPLFNSESFAGGGRKYISFSTAVFDILQQESTAYEGRIEYQGTEFYSNLKPITGLMLNTDGAVHLYAGIFVDIPITNFLYFSPSFAPGLYLNQKSKDLYFLLEFRSQIEIAFKLGSEIKVGVSFNHISNASLGKVNPGVESIALTYHFPL
jgi:hypothetical protein